VTGGPDELGEDGHQAVILKTTDAGLTWTRQSGNYVYDEHHPYYFLGISAADADTAWAVGSNYTLVKTTDGGATWTKDPYFGGLYDINEVYAVSTSTVWVAGDNAIYRTTDGGQSWDNSADHGLAGCIAYMGISAVSAQKAWGSYVHETLVGHIAYTTDGGNTWTKVEKLCEECEFLPNLGNISFATQPINPNYLIISLIEDVELLVDDGFLNQGQGNALIVKLDQVLDRLADDRLKPAVNALDAFSNQVDAFVRGGVLSPEIGQDLSDQVNDIIKILRFPL
jgi:photosystem II stability/assembly factor-like uncharacterized protein